MLEFWITVLLGFPGFVVSLLDLYDLLIDPHDKDS